MRGLIMGVVMSKYSSSRFKAAETYKELLGQVDAVVHEFDIAEDWAVGDVLRYDYEHDFEDRKLLYGATCEALNNIIHIQCATDRFIRFECRESDELQNRWEFNRFIRGVKDKSLKYWEHRMLVHGIIIGEILVFDRYKNIRRAIGIFEVNFKKNVTKVKMFYSKFCGYGIRRWFNNY